MASVEARLACSAYQVQIASSTGSTQGDNSSTVAVAATFESVVLARVQAGPRGMSAGGQLSYDGLCIGPRSGSPTGTDLSSTATEPTPL